MADQQELRATLKQRIGAVQDTYARMKAQLDGFLAEHGYENRILILAILATIF